MAKLIKPLVFVAALVPFVFLVSRILRNDLGPDPAEELAIETGEWTLRFLILTLALSPLRRISNNIEFVRIRRMLGLYTFFYATLHFTVWLTFLLGFRWSAGLEESIARPYSAVGFSAYVIVLSLALASPYLRVRKLAPYPTRLLRLGVLDLARGVVHLLWILRLDIGPAVFYGTLVFLLLGYRLFYYVKARTRLFS